MVPEEIQHQLIKFRYHILGAFLVCFGLFSFFYLAPRFLNILAYFWPLFLSTALFLLVVLFFAKTSSSQTSLPKPGEDLLDYVAGHHPDPPLDDRNKSD